MIPPENNKAEVGSPMDTDYRLSHRYWTRQAAERPELMGVSDIGGCGSAEVLYRHFEEVRHLRSIVEFDQQKTVLEMGSGNGRWIISLAPLVNHYIAIDFSQQMLDIARNRTELLNLNNISFCRAAAQNYTPSIPIDILYLSGVSQYLHDADLLALLKRMNSSLKPGAVLIDRSTIHRHQHMLAGQPDYFCIYRTAEELRGIFEEAGFMLHYQRQSYRFLNMPGIINWLLSCRLSTNIVDFTAPLSFHLLRALAWVKDHIWGPTGEVIDFSHDFFIFHRRNR